MRPDFNLYLITDRRRVAGGGLVAAVRAALDGGVRAVQLREKDLPRDELLRLAGQLRDLTREYRARLLINSHIDLALAVEADGVHLPQGTAGLERARERLGPDRLLGISTHDLAELRTAERCGADFVTFGPVFATPSKLPFGAPVGLAALQEACSKTDLPVFALGGVGRGNLKTLETSGVAGIALIGDVLATPDPTAAARRLLQELEGFPAR